MGFEKWEIVCWLLIMLGKRVKKEGFVFKGKFEGLVDKYIVGLGLKFEGQGRDQYDGDMQKIEIGYGDIVIRRFQRQERKGLGRISFF